MPDFKVIPAAEAAAKTASTKRAQVLQEYVTYIRQLATGQAGSLRAASGESLSTVRRRLGDAAKLVNRPLVIRRTEDEIIFWAKPGRAGAPKRPRGRPRKNPLA